MKDFSVFIVEDDIWYSEILEYHLSLNPDYAIEKFGNGNDCLKSLHKKPNVITVDYSLPDMSGHELIKQIQIESPGTPIIVISAQENIKTAIKLLAEPNVYDYIVKDEDTNDRLWKSIINIREKAELKQEIQELRTEIEKKYSFEKLIKGNSPAIKRVFQLIEKACKTNISVSITGETGTGKELIAKSIHYNSDRKNKKLVAVNVSAIPAELIESELFGHEKGAFTGANARRIGKFEEAHEGTLFLDEIGEMDLAMQAKLLRVLQEREVTRIGSNSNVKIDIRIICATHRNLAEEVQKGNFREDLYYRLLGLPIELPPLRDRGEDVLILSKFFLDEFSKTNGMPKIKISNDSRDKLKKYPFPGNIRELKAVIELAAVMADNQEIEPQDITFSNTSNIGDLMMQEMSLKEYNSRIIRHYLDKYNGEIPLVAEKLDIGKSTIYRHLKNQTV